MEWREAWREYRVQQFDTWRRFAFWAASITLLVSPLSFGYGLYLLRDDGIPDLSARGFLAVHGYMATTSAVYLVLLRRRTRRPVASRFDNALLGFGVASVILSGAAITSLNQLGTGSMSMFAMSVALTLVVSFLPAPAFIALVAASAAMIVIATHAWQENAVLAVGARANVVAIVIAAAVLYPVYDRWRFREYQRRKALQASLDVKSTLVRALGHDLRTPLVGIRRVARILDDGSLDRAKRRELADELDALTHRFSLVLDNLMTLERRPESSGGAPLGPASLADVLDRVVDLCRHDARRKAITVTTELEDDVLLAAERETLVAALDNLLGNALKFTPHHGRVAIVAEIEPERVRIAVHDSGVGITPEALARLRRDERIPASSGTDGELGVGIGLGVVRSLLAPLGSTLEFEARAGGGTTARFTVPRYKGA